MFVYQCLANNDLILLNDMVKCIKYVIDVRFRSGEMEKVSVIMPVYNESKYITGLIQSLRRQDYEHNSMELLFVDSNSIDNTVELIDLAMENADITYSILHNPERNVSKSLNKGIGASTGDIVVRLDGHTEITDNYISLNVKYLKATGAVNVGCLIDTISEGTWGNAIASVLSSSFGVGNSNFRIGSESRYVDTVPFGCWWRKTFDELGLYNEALTRSEDNEFNSRILKNGGKIYLFNDICTIYHPRDTVGSLMAMGYANGCEIIQTIFKFRESFRFRYIIPLLFVLFLLAGDIGSMFTVWVRVPFVAILLIYLILDIVFSFFKQRTDKISFLSGCASLIIYPLFHISYGVGSLMGIIDYIFKGRSRENKSENKKY